MLNQKFKDENSELLTQAGKLANDAHQILKLIQPSQKREKRGLVNIGGKAIKFVFGNPDSDDWEQIKEYMINIEKNQIANINTINQISSSANRVGNEINKDLEIIGKNLNKTRFELNNQQREINVFEATMILIIQEINYIKLLNKIRESFNFSESSYSLELLNYDQIEEIRKHLFKIYSTRELTLSLHDLLDFRFIKGSIVLNEHFIIYTLKIPILNPVEFSLSQRLAVVNEK